MRVVRSIRIGGMGKAELLRELRERGVEFNEAGLKLFESDRFLTAEESGIITVAEVSVADLGYHQGATMRQLFESAALHGLEPCPLEVGPHFRLQYLDQPEGYWGYPPSQHRAPPGSVTIVSRPLSSDEDFPKGFYLRRIQGVLWLRGFRSGPDHIYSPEDRFAFFWPSGAIVG